MKGKIKRFLGALAWLISTWAIQWIVAVSMIIIISIKYIRKENVDNLALRIKDITLGMTNYILIIYAILTVLICFIVYTVRKKNFIRELQIFKINKINIIMCVCLGVAGLVVNDGVMTLIRNAGLFKENFETTERMLSPLGNGSMFIIILSVGIMVPIAEEVIFRGAIFNTLSKNFSIGWTIIIQGVLFGVFHQNLIQGCYAAVLGIIFGYVVYKTKSLWSTIIIHIVNNTVSTLSGNIEL